MERLAYDPLILEYFGAKNDPSYPFPEVDPPSEAHSIAELYRLMRYGRWTDVLANTQPLERTLPESESFHVVYCKLVALFKLRRYAEIEREIMSVLMFQPSMIADSNPLKRGLIFSLKLMQAELPHHLPGRKTKVAIQNIDNLLEQTRRSNPNPEEWALFRVIAAVRQADLYVQIGNFPAAVVHLNQAIVALGQVEGTRQALEPHLWTAMGRIFFSIGDLENCKNAFDKVGGTLPSEEEQKESKLAKRIQALMATNHAILLVAEEKYQEAMMEFQLLVGQDEDDEDDSFIEPICVNNLALCALHIGRVGAAVEYLEDAVRTKPSSSLTPVVVANLLKLYQVLPGYTSRAATLAKICQVYAPDALTEARLLVNTSNTRTTVAM
jgi:tetratricopeptide (TPR) repeat protein